MSNIVEAGTQTSISMSEKLEKYNLENNFTNNHLTLFVQHFNLKKKQQIQGIPYQICTDADVTKPSSYVFFPHLPMISIHVLFVKIFF